MKKIKVCHVSSVHPPFDVRIFHKECCSLAKAGYDTHMVVTGAESQERNGVKVHGVADPKRGRLYRMIKHAGEVIDRARDVNADIYHLHDPELLPYAIGLRAHGAKVIFDSHEDLPRQTMSKEYIPKIIRKATAQTLYYYEDHVAKNIDAIVCATKSIKDRFKDLNRNTVIVNNFPFVMELRNKPVKVEQERAVCYVGSVARMRGALEIVQAVGLTDVKLFLAGTIAEPGLHDKLIVEPGWKQVDELGFVPRKEVAAVMAKSIAGLVTLYPEPNHLDSIPIKMFEYLSASIPIICSNFDSWRELLHGVDCARFVNPRDPREIADAINWLVNHPKEAKEMGQRGQKIVETKFNWENEEKQLLSLYQKIME